MQVAGTVPCYWSQAHVLAGKWKAAALAAPASTEQIHASQTPVRQVQARASMPVTVQEQQTTNLLEMTAQPPN